MRTALTIAGSDSGGGAGIQADLKTFAAHGVFGMSAITAVTAQNTLTVTRSLALPPDLVTAQIDAVTADLPVHAVKIGMLANAAIVDAVAASIRRHRLSPVVLDPVMIAKGGAPLLADDAVHALRSWLLPLATLVTPNAPEAGVLTGRAVTTIAELRDAARALLDLGASAVMVKGGHLEGPAVDVLATPDSVVELHADRVPTRHTHGTGCTLSAAIAARLALGDDLRSAVAEAKAYVERAIRQAPGLGHGHGPLQHFPT
ncbi:MAG TPA: bifunctional hydroxymethylpyrimidine kinase/phosphomethylpyrimidine kinase [Vicinamibacterales bacterium]|nr:bifunctional hydroxymethylpyrimidine kinase/phosphomethylpyrimidine kinase [Vicinamibacterales bacterium]